MTQYEIKEGKGLSIVSYLGVIGILIAYFMNNDKKNGFVSFNVRQSMGLWIMFHLFAFVASSFDSWMVTSAFYLCFAVLIIYALINVVNEKVQTVPVVGDLFQRIFANVGE
ncbi:MAG: hypothetical protein ACON5F_05405 [Jejuia sp.]